MFFQFFHSFFQRNPLFLLYAYLLSDETFYRTAVMKEKIYGSIARKRFHTSPKRDEESVNDIRRNARKTEKRQKMKNEGICIHDKHTKRVFRCKDPPV